MSDHWQSATNERKAMVRKGVITIILLCLLALLIYAGIHIFEAKTQNQEPRGDLQTRFTPAPTILYNGAAYRQKTRLTTILMMGIDTMAETTTDGASFRSGGQADYLILLVIDHEGQTITPIQIDRDTMAEITILGILGNVTGTRLTQICLSHGFGDGREQSCQLTKEAASRLLLGVDIQFYFALNLDGIATLNDALGGVTVTLADDFTSLDASMQKGTTLTLQGKQAEYFVRSRMSIGVGTNEARMVRQQVFWDGLSQRIKERIQTENSANFIGDLFDLLKPYLITDMSRGRLINEVWKSHDYSSHSAIHPSGTYETGDDGFIEFHVNEAALENLVIKTYFQKSDQTPS